MLQGFRSRITATVIGILLITVISILLIIKYEEDRFFSASYRDNSLNLISTIKFSVDNEYKSLLFHEKSILNERKNKLKDMVDLAYIATQTYYQDYIDGKISLATAQRQALEALKEFRYDEQVGYIWVNDTTRPIPRMLMHPILPHLDGELLTDDAFYCALGAQKHLFVAFNDVCEVAGSGFVDYLWPKPTPDGITEDQPKLSYVRLFPPWNWIIGSGLYIDDIEKEKQRKLISIKQNLREMFEKIRIANSGYMFVLNGNHELLIHPAYEGSRNLANPVTGDNILSETITAYQSGKKYLDYIWDKPPDDIGNYSYHKRMYIEYFKPLDWYIVSSVYLEDVEKAGHKLWREIIWLSFILIIVAFFIAIALSKNLSLPLLKLSDAALFIKQQGLQSIRMPINGTYETKNLGQIINEMIESIIQKDKEKEHIDIKFKAIFDQTYQLIGVLDNEGHLQQANRSAMEMISEPFEDIAGKYFWDTPWWNYSPQLQEKLKNHLHAAMQGAFVRFEAPHIHKDGSIHYLDFSLKPIFDVDGNISIIIPEARDITDRKHQEQEIKKLNSELEIRVKQRTAQLQQSLEKLRNTQKQLVRSKTMASLGGLVAGVAHEINTPVGIGVSLASYENEEITKIKALYEENKMSQHDFEAFLGIISESSLMILHNLEKASNLIKSFKMVAVDTASFDKRKFNVKEYIQEILLSLKNYLKNKDFDIVLNIDENLELDTYPGVLSQIITNLVLNSIKHGFEGREKGLINIQLAIHDNNVKLVYADDGKGIPTENLNKIFEPFFTTKRNMGGSGLGLNIIHNIISAHLNGHIEVKNLVQGVEFRVIFPLE